MRAEVDIDRTVRTVMIQVTGVPDLDVTQSWHRKARLIRPDRATITVVNGVATRIEIKGGLVLKSGAASTEVRDKAEWRRESYSPRDKIEEAPAWVQTLWRQAPAGVTSWNEPEAQTL